MLDLSNLKSCPKCSQDFSPKRSNQKYCSDACRKNATRGSRKPENKNRTIHHYARASDLEHMVYSVPPSDRLGMMKHILEYVPHDAGLRNILSDPKLLREEPRKSGRKNISQAASAYTRKFFGLSIQTYMQKTTVGEKIEGIEVSRKVDLGPIPNIKHKITKPRCWHNNGQHLQTEDCGYVRTSQPNAGL